MSVMSPPVNECVKFEVGPTNGFRKRAENSVPEGGTGKANPLSTAIEICSQGSN